MNRLKVSSIMLVIVLFITMVSSFAWISLATVNKIENISLNAIEGYDLEISLDGVDYYTNLNKDQILNKMKWFTFKEVTSLDGRNFKTSYKNDELAIKDKDYLNLTFYFRTNSSYTEIHLSDLITDASYDNPPTEGTFITSEGRRFRSTFDFQYGPEDIVTEGEIRTYYVRDAMRVSFYDNNLNTTKIFDLSGNEERGFGKPYGMIAYFNHYKGKNLVPPEAPETLYTLSEFEESSPYAKTFDSHLITLTQSESGYYEGSVEVNIWLEGWDADAFDAVYDDKIKIQFMFRAVRPKS